MPAPLRRPAVVPVRRLVATVYGYWFLNDLVLLYPVYALFFVDTGLSVAQISSLFGCWVLPGLVLELPSGVWADAVSRRLLLVLGPLLTAVGFLLWMLAPGYWAFAVGFLLWGTSGALRSGALEALVYEELDRVGAADRYATVAGRSTSLSMFAAMVAMAAAGPVLAYGGFLAVGLGSVVTALGSAWLGWLLPEHRRPTGPRRAEPARGRYLTVLRAGLAEARRDRRVRRTLLLIPAVGAIWGAVEEYVPLLAVENGAAATQVPLLILLVQGGAAAGGLLVGYGSRWRSGVLAGTLAGGAVVLGVGGVSGSWAGLVLVALAFGGFHLVTGVEEARLQELVGGESRATVTSLAGLGTSVAIAAVYGVYAAASTVAGHGWIFALFGCCYLLVALVLGWTGRRGARTP